jgi:hypothetical protein
MYILFVKDRNLPSVETGLARPAAPRAQTEDAAKEIEHAPTMRPPARVALAARTKHPKFSPEKYQPKLTSKRVREAMASAARSIFPATVQQLATGWTQCRIGSEETDA